MTKTRFNQKHKEVLDSILLKIPGVVSGKMFGYPAYYVRKKLFACLYEEGVGIKVPEVMANKLIGKNSISHFQPMGRAKMKEWIQINRKNSVDYLKDRNIFKSSIKFVSSMAKSKEEEC